MTEATSLNIAKEYLTEQDDLVDAEVRLYYQSLEATRLSRAFATDQAKCSASVRLGEALWLSPQSTLLPFSFSVETNPRVFVIRVKGHIFVEGSPQSIRYLTDTEGDEPPRVWSRVCREILRIASDLAGSLDLSLPEELRRRK